jgi:hypothetical protein
VKVYSIIEQRADTKNRGGGKALEGKNGSFAEILF